ncbi:MAG TPA: DM13 domain-containing protein [Gaiellaceae bacterium]|nr:DM13 domain-containing protein [Gaiellaceae bacterium]
MAALSRKPRLVLPILVVAVLGGLAAGIAVARGGSSVSHGPPGVVSSGTFRTITWSTTGTATVVRDASGHLKLRLGKDFNTRRGPDVWVYLARYDGSVWRGRRVEWKLLGRVTRAWGSATYDLPADAARPGMSIAIFCGECGRLSGLAQLEPVHPATAA